MKTVLASIFALSLLPNLSLALGAPAGWQSEIISLISSKQFKAAGEKLKEHCIDKKNGELCLVLASAYFEGEEKFGIQAKEIVKAYKYTKLACEHGAEAGCKAYRAAINEGELLQYVLFTPNIIDRDAQLKEAIQLGANLNATTLFTATLLQKAINDVNLEAVHLLLKNGVDVNYRVSEEDLTPLMYAINTGNIEMTSLLLEHGADPKKSMKVADYLNMGTEEANACDFAENLKNQEMLALLNCMKSQ